ISNGGGVVTQDFTFPAVSASAGDVIYIASESTGFTSYFGFAPDHTSSAANFNGDDALELYENGTVIDTFGEPSVDGSGQAWEYMDGWAYRNDGATASATFDISQWSFSGIDALDGEATND